MDSAYESIMAGLTEAVEDAQSAKKTLPRETVAADTVMKRTEEYKNVSRKDK